MFWSSTQLNTINLFKYLDTKKLLWNKVSNRLLTDSLWSGQFYKHNRPLIVPWHKTILLQSMLPINVLIKVAFLFFQGFLQEILIKSQVSKIFVPETRARVSLLLELHYYGFPCFSKYDSISLLVALNIIAWVFLLL